MAGPTPISKFSCLLLIDVINDHKSTEKVLSWIKFQLLTTRSYDATQLRNKLTFVTLSTFKTDVF